MGNRRESTDSHKILCKNLLNGWILAGCRHLLLWNYQRVWALNGITSGKHRQSSEIRLSVRNHQDVNDSLSIVIFIIRWKWKRCHSARENTLTSTQNSRRRPPAAIKTWRLVVFPLPRWTCRTRQQYARIAWRIIPSRWWKSMSSTPLKNWDLHHCQLQGIVYKYNS